MTIVDEWRNPLTQSEEENLLNDLAASFSHLSIALADARSYLDKHHGSVDTNLGAEYRALINRLAKLDLNNPAGCWGELEGVLADHIKYRSEEEAFLHQYNGETVDLEEACDDQEWYNLFEEDDAKNGPTKPKHRLFHFLFRKKALA